jgi:hypothetical protein
LIIGPRCKLYRSSCNGVEVQLRVEPDCAWLTIKRAGEERQYRDIADADVEKVLADFQAIGTNPEKFKAFVNAAEAQPVAWVVFSAKKTGDSRADESPAQQPDL